MKKVLICLCALLIVCLCGFLVYKSIYKNNVESFTYNDGYAPSTIYKIKINRKTKKVSAEFEYTCSAKDCENRIEKCDTTLTTDEYNKIMRIIGKKEIVSPIIDNICKGDKVFYQSFENSHEDSINDYNKMDTNKDGIVSYREFGNYRLSNEKVN